MAIGRRLFPRVSWLLGVGAIAVAAALFAGLPPAYDAGRLGGIALAAALLARTDRLDARPSVTGIPRMSNHPGVTKRTGVLAVIPRSPSAAMRRG